MEEVAEGIIKHLAKSLLAIGRFALWLTIEVMWDTLLWYVGWPVARALTLGNLPKQTITNSDNEEPLIFFFVVITGLVTLTLSALLLFKFA